MPPSAGTVATLPTVRPGTADPGLVCNTAAGTPSAQQPAMPGSAGKSDGSNLFDALLLAASGGENPCLHRTAFDCIVQAFVLTFLYAGLAAMNVSGMPHKGCPTGIA